MLTPSLQGQLNANFTAIVSTRGLSDRNTTLFHSALRLRDPEFAGRLLRSFLTTGERPSGDALMRTAHRFHEGLMVGIPSECLPNPSLFSSVRLYLEDVVAILMAGALLLRDEFDNSLTLLWQGSALEGVRNLHSFLNRQSTLREEMRSAEAVRNAERLAGALNLAREADFLHQSNLIEDVTEMSVTEIYERLRQERPEGAVGAWLLARRLAHERIPLSPDDILAMHRLLTEEQAELGHPIEVHHRGILRDIIVYVGPRIGPRLVEDAESLQTMERFVEREIVPGSDELRRTLWIWRTGGRELIRIDTRGEWESFRAGMSNRLEPFYFLSGGLREVPRQEDFQSLVDDYNRTLQETPDDPLEILRTTARYHLRFEAMHPFADGNGRIGRIMVNYGLELLGQPVLVFTDEDKRLYYDAFPDKGWRDSTRMEDYFFLKAAGSR